MASVKFTRDDPEWAVLNEFWLLLQKHYQVEDNEDYWKNVIADIDSFWKGKEPKILRRELSNALINILERKNKEVKENVGK